jgi:copper homeostasis protein
MKNTIEIACFTYNDAIVAAEAGASRIEFCSDYAVGGLSPNTEETATLIKNIKIPVFVMLRLNSGFYYNENDFTEYKKQIEAFKTIGVSGFVIGFLEKNNEIAISFNKKLIDLIQPFPCTFHRAIDYTANYFESIKTVIDLGFNRILTSGGKGNAIDYLDNLAEANKRFGNKIIILPGGGIRSSNLSTIKSKSNFKEFHSAAMINGTINPSEINALLNA